MFIIFSFQNLLPALTPKSNLIVTPPVLRSGRNSENALQDGYVPVYNLHEGVHLQGSAQMPSDNPQREKPFKCPHYEYR